MPDRAMVKLILISMFILGSGALVPRHALADFATPFVEINNKVGDVSEGHGYVVALGHKVESCKHFLVVVTTDCEEHIVLEATADNNVVKEPLLGRPVIIKAEVVDRKEDPKTKRATVKLKILSVKSSKKKSEG